ncbi:MAG TPA: bifunctional phosphoribosyl-AMP cyclohydrolase/phosphoribosyl-ATP diphosphatase HisIE [Acidimicrobiia bacterium]
MSDREVRFDEDGLVPGIVQDARSARVLMLGYLSRGSLELTRSTGQVHFWSRSRGELWRKGDTSGNTLQVVDIAVDCDGDALLIRANPAGPTCHTGAVSCFDAGTTIAAAAGFAALDDLWRVIISRATERPAGSYTVDLLDGGVDAVSRKVAEEATEVVLAAKDHATGGPAARVAEEAADLLYHLLVLLAERGVEPQGVIDVLAARRR